MVWTLEHCPANEEWSKIFPTEAEAVAELVKHICADCLKGEILIGGGPDEGPRLEKLCEPPNTSSASDLLSTPCGCEYELYSDAADAVTR